MWAAHLDPKWAVKMAAMTVAMMVERMAGCLVLHWAEQKVDCSEELMAVCWADWMVQRRAVK